MKRNERMKMKNERMKRMKNEKEMKEPIVVHWREEWQIT